MNTWVYLFSCQAASWQFISDNWTFLHDVNKFKYYLHPERETKIGPDSSSPHQGDRDRGAEGKRAWPGNGASIQRASLHGAERYAFLRVASFTQHHAWKIRLCHGMEYSFVVPHHCRICRPHGGFFVR